MKPTDKFIDLFGSKTQAQSSFAVNAIAYHYPTFIKIYTPKEPFQKLLPFMEGTRKRVRRAKSRPELEHIYKYRSMRRTERLISDLCLLNDFNQFATFTLSPKKTEDRANADKVKSQISNWFKNIIKRKGKFIYLVVPEYHKDGKSLHFHVLMKDYTGELIPTGKKIKGRDAYNFKSYTLGINSLVNIDNIEAVSRYVRKYITKDMPTFKGKHRFWASKGLKRPRVQYNPDDWYSGVTPDWSSENEYGFTSHYLNSSSSATESHNLTVDSTKRSTSEKET